MEIVYSLLFCCNLLFTFTAAIIFHHRLQKPEENLLKYIGTLHKSLHMNKNCFILLFYYIDFSSNEMTIVICYFIRQVQAKLNLLIVLFKCSWRWPYTESCVQYQKTSFYIIFFFFFLMIAAAVSCFFCLAQSVLQLLWELKMMKDESVG